MRQLGPPPSYPPDNVTLPLAMLRAAMTFAIAVLLSPANRLRAAATANKFGWNHVTLSLHQLHRNSRRVRFADPNKPELNEAEGGGLNEASANSESGYSNSSSTTHGTRSVHTASYDIDSTSGPAAQEREEDEMVRKRRTTAGLGAFAE